MPKRLELLKTHHCVVGGWVKKVQKSAYVIYGRSLTSKRKYRMNYSTLSSILPIKRTILLIILFEKIPNIPIKHTVH